MNNKGYTRIPNAIIRSRFLTVEEKMLWMYVASMPVGYRFSVREACANIRINIKTWRRCVASLKRLGLIEVDSVPGKKNVYRVLTPSVLDPGSQTVPLPNETPTPLPNETRGTHSYKKDHLKNIVVADAHTHTREDFIADALNDLRVEQGCMAMRITPDEYRQLVTEVTNDWIFRNIPDEEWTLTHLLAQMRIKHNINNRNNGTNPQYSSPDSIRAKLDADAVKAMAALASEIGKPKVVPF